MKTLETKRLIIRKPKRSDLKDYYEFAKLNDVGPTAGWLPHESISYSRRVLIDNIKRGDVWHIELKEEKKVIGTINLEVPDFYHALNSIVELGYAINSNYWNKGYATEAAKALIDYAFKDLSFEKIVCGHSEFNEASKHVILKLGFKFVRIDTNRVYENENIDKVYVYELKKEDYKG